MKMIYCTCDVSFQNELTDLLEKSEISDYQVIEKALSKNREGEPRYNTPVWPGYNSIVMAQIRDEKKVKAIIESIRERNAKAAHKNELITLCTWTIEDYIYD